MAQESMQDTVRRVHAVLTGRGWLIDEPSIEDVDEDGFPTHQRIHWIYPLSYGGVTVHHIEYVSPEPAACLFSLDAVDDIDSILMVEAGNSRGCPAHTKVERDLARDEIELLAAELE